MTLELDYPRKIDMSLCTCAKKLKLDHAEKWDIYKSKSVSENEIDKTLNDFERQTDFTTPVKRRDHVLKIKIKKKKQQKRTV